MKQSHLFSFILIIGLLTTLMLTDRGLNTLPEPSGRHISSPPPPAAPFDNIILMIGDGMGWGQLNATMKFLGPSVNLTIEELTYLGDVETYSLNDPATDSAAAATALATGNRTNNNMVSMTPSGKILTSILEASEALGKSSGLVTTTPVSHGTPAAFGAHVPHRSDQLTIASQEINKGIEVLLGGGKSWFTTLLGQAYANGYYLVENRTELLNAVMEDYLLGLFSDGDLSYEYDRDPLLDPHILEMTNISLQILERNPNGFFLMVEGGRIDHASHNNDINNTIGEVIAFNEAVEVAYEFAQQNSGTLLIVVADHETGGLIVNMSSPVLDYQFTSTAHTGAPVPVFVYCSDPLALPPFSHIEDIGKYLFEAFELPAGHLPVEWIDTPSNQIVEYGDSCYYALKAYAATSLDTWWINNTAQFTIDGTGIIQNTTALSIGKYGLEVHVNDTRDITITATFAFIIQDTTPPEWVTPPSNQVLESGESLDYQLHAIDLSGISYWLINDTTHFAIDSTGHITSIVALAPGTYGLNITVSDPYNNAISSTFTILVQQETLPPPAIPGFPFAAILIGLITSLALILIVRRKK